MSNALDEMNNWAATSKWLEAIAKDLNVISEKSEREALSSRELRHRLEADERKMKTKIEQYEEEIRLIESRTREHESKISLMKSEMEKLAKEKNQLVDEVNVKDSQIKITTLNLEKKIEEVKKNYAKKLTKKKEEGVEKEARWKKKLECETKRKNELEFENSTLENSIKKLEQDLETANSARSDEKNALELHCQELENELKNLKEENSNLNLIIVQKQNIVDDYSRRIMEAFPPLTSNSKTAYIG